MKFSSRSQVEALSRFRSEKYLTLSLFLDTDKSRASKKEILTAAKNLLAEARARLEALDASKEKKAALAADLDKAQELAVREIDSGAPGLAVYACSGENFLEVLSLPEAPRNRIVFDRNPYIRPLTQILGQYRSLAVFLVDRRQAKWYASAMGEIALLDEMKSEAPKPLVGGDRDKTRSVERRAEAAAADHYKKAAQKTFEIFKKNGFEGLVLGCPDGLVSEIEPHLHAYVRERLRGWLRAKPTDAPDAVLKETMALEKAIRKSEEEAMVKQFAAELEKGGRACSGLKDSLKALALGEVQTLIVTKGFAAAGRSCPRCRLLYVEDEVKCPACDRKTEAVLDVVDEAIEAAMRGDAQIRSVQPPSRLDRYGQIGALLRFKA
jgi:peptide chain release factor subunit 1